MTCQPDRGYPEPRCLSSAAPSLSLEEPSPCPHLDVFGWERRHREQWWRHSSWTPFCRESLARLQPVAPFRHSPIKCEVGFQTTNPHIYRISTWISRKEMSMLWMTSTLSTLGSSNLLFILLSCSFSSSPEYCSLHLARSDLNFSLRCSLDCTTSSFSSCFSLWTSVCWQENPSPWRSPRMSEKMSEPSCC